MAQYNWRTSGAVSIMTKEKTNMNNTKKEAIDTINEILDLIEDSDDSLRFSPDYIYNILSRIKKELI
tara:strand:- start:2847 stop:3047 length:201 start_codon:yes stop_codon:yes gene_type:complete